MKLIIKPASTQTHKDFFAFQRYSKFNRYVKLPVIYGSFILNFITLAYFLLKLIN